MASPLTPSSTIHIYPTPIFISAPIPENPPTNTTPATVEPLSPPSTEPSSYLSTPQLLTAPQTLIPPTALAVKAKSTKTIGAASKPVIQQEGPVEVEPPPAKDKKVGRVKSPTISDDSKRPKTKNGYLPPGTSLAAASSKDKEKTKKKKKKADDDDDEEDDDDDVDEGKKWMRYEAVESSITTTVEALEGGGTRTVWVRTDRDVTVR
ncbi:MAG: hypothetical protein ASARMPREDX12_001408 [Alectoria sarmentosa]|nr:MAG: hypothetical protein ASARMPREDX12_001408 [Alectoria sarmentosa]